MTPARRALRSLLLLFVQLSGVSTALADVVVTAAQVRLAPPGSANSAAFMTLHNQGASDRRLVGASSPLVSRVELHTHYNDDGVLRMRALTGIEIKAGSQVTLKSGADHLMLIGLRGALTEGQTVSITLNFDDDSQQVIAAPVRRFHPEPESTSRHPHH